MAMTVATVRFRPAWRGALFYLFHWGAVGAYLPFLNVYFVEQGFTGRQLGLLAMLFPLATLLCAPLFSSLADRTGQRVYTLQLALTGVVFTFIVLGQVETFWRVVAVMLLLAIARSPVLALADSLIVRLASQHGVPFGNLRLVGSLGFALFSVLCGMLWQRWGYAPMFWVTALLFLPTIGIASGLQTVAEAQTAVQRVPLRTILQDRALVTLLLATWLMGITLGVAIIFEGIIMAALGGGQLLIGVFLGVIGFSEIPGMRLSGELIKRLGGRPTLLLAYVLFGGAFAGYALAGSPTILMIFGVIRGLGFGLFLASTVTLLNDNAPPGWAATVQSLREAGMFGLAPLLVAPVAGLLYDRWGAAAPFWLAVASTGLAILVLVARHSTAKLQA
jgi:MFS family permease